MTDLELTSPPAESKHPDEVDERTPAARHPLIATMDRISTMPLPAEVRAILLCLARHGDWNELNECRPKMTTVARWAGLGERQTQRLMRRLWCSPRTPCIGDGQCPHYGLIHLEREASPGRPATWRLDLDPVMFQLQIPDVGAGPGRLATIAEPPTCRECREPHHAHGLCGRHYQQARRREAGQRAARQAPFGTERRARTA